MSSRRLALGVLILITFGWCGIARGGDASPATLPDGYMGVAESQRILDKTITIHLAPDLSYLSQSERQTIDILLQVGAILHNLYLESKHHQSLSA